MYVRINHLCVYCVCIYIYTCVYIYSRWLCYSTSTSNSTSSSPSFPFSSFFLSLVLFILLFLLLLHHHHHHFFLLLCLILLSSSYCSFFFANIIFINSSTESTAPSSNRFFSAHPKHQRPRRSSCSAKCESPGFTFHVWLSRTDKSIPWLRKWTDAWRKGPPCHWGPSVPWSSNADFSKVSNLGLGTLMNHCCHRLCKQPVARAKQYGVCFCHGKHQVNVEFFIEAIL